MSKLQLPKLCFLCSLESGVDLISGKLGVDWHGGSGIVAVVKVKVEEMIGSGCDN